MLKIHTLPETGGDTLWGSAYEAYDRMSEPMQKFMEGLTATHDANFFHDEARRLGIPIKAKNRGHPLNEGEDLRAVHPVVRTNRESRRRTGFQASHRSLCHCDPPQLSLVGRACSSTMPSPSESTGSPGMKTSKYRL
jgi:alpha-ketoglutarate-dependent taurine dioxygenase